MAKAKKNFDLATVILAGVIVILVFSICFVAFGGFSKNPAESDNHDAEFQALIDNGDYKSAYEHMLNCDKCPDPDTKFKTVTKFKCVTKTDLDGNLIEETKYVFDKKGNILQETVTTASYDKYNVNEYTYEYYEDGTKKYKKHNNDTSCYEEWFDEKGTSIKQFNHDKETETKTVTEFTCIYDANGCLISKKMFDNGVLLKTLKYSYDSSLRNTEIKEYNADDLLITTDYYKYDASGNLIEKGTVYSEHSDVTGADKDVYVYDAQGNMIEETFYGLSGNYLGKHQYKYDAQGNVIEKKDYNSLVLTWTWEYKYDANNNLIEENAYNNDGLIEKTQYKYDDFGNILERNVYNYDEDRTFGEKYVYSDQVTFYMLKK